MKKACDKTLSERLNADLKTAMRAKDKKKLTLLRSVKSTFQNKEIDSGSPITEAEETAILLKLIKQRHEAAEGFRQGDAEERALNEDWEAQELENYLPPAPSEEELEASISREIAKIDAADRSPKSMGKVMKALNEEFAGRPIDGKALSQKVRAKLLA